MFTCSSKQPLRARIAREIAMAERYRLLQVVPSSTKGKKVIHRAVRFIYDPTTSHHHPTLQGVVVTADGTSFEIDTASYIEWILYLRGSYEKEVNEFLKSQLPAGGTFFDIGANIGVHTCSIARSLQRNGSVYAIEPFPALVERLLVNIAINNLSNVIVLNTALSQNNQTLSLHVPSVPRGNFGMSSVARRIPGVRNDQITVPATTLDSVVTSHSINRLDVIKVDVEGHELPVLLGAIETIREFRPTIVFEDLGMPNSADGGDFSGPCELLRKMFDYQIGQLTATMKVASVI